MNYDKQKLEALLDKLDCNDCPVWLGCESKDNKVNCHKRWEHDVFQDNNPVHEIVRAAIDDGSYQKSRDYKIKILEETQKQIDELSLNPEVNQAQISELNHKKYLIEITINTMNMVIENRKEGKC